MEFPSSPTNGQLFTNFGKVYEYSIYKSAWFPINFPLRLTDIVGVDETINPQVGDVIISDENLLTSGTINGLIVYQFISQLPLSGNEAGALALVSENSHLYLWTGVGWYTIVLVNTNPTITTGPDATYALNSDGTPTVITLVATDPEGVPLTWSHSVTSGLLEDTIISNTGAEFTITPGAIAATFDLTFTTSDGVKFATAVSSFTLSFGPDWSTTTLVYTLDNPNAYGTSAGDSYGSVVAISGNYAVVGAFQEADAGGTGSGKAYIHNIITGALVHTLDNPNAYGTSTSDLFGSSVAISGNYAVVGAMFEDDAGGSGSGKAYIFDVTTGALLFTLNNPNAYGTSAWDDFGRSISVSGDYAIVGALYEGDAGGSGSGAAYIFNVTTGALVHTLLNPNAFGTSAGDQFGAAVAISDTYAIVGAKEEDDAGGTSSGKAYIFSMSTGALVHTLNNPNAYGTSTSDLFGAAVAIGGSYAIVGAEGEDDAGGLSSGKVYIYDVTTSALIRTLDNPNAYSTSANDSFGKTVAINGDYVVVGAYLEGDSGSVGTTPMGSGKVYIFDVTTGVLLQTLDNPNAYGTSATDQFGAAIAIGGSYVIVGARYEDDAGGTSSGKAYIFQAG